MAAGGFPSVIAKDVNADEPHHGCYLVAVAAKFLEVGVARLDQVGFNAVQDLCEVLLGDLVSVRNVGQADKHGFRRPSVVGFGQHAAQPCDPGQLFIGGSFGVNRIVAVSTKGVGDVDCAPSLGRKGEEREVEVPGLLFGQEAAGFVGIGQIDGRRGRCGGLRAGHVRVSSRRQPVAQSQFTGEPGGQQQPGFLAF